MDFYRLETRTEVDYTDFAKDLTLLAYISAHSEFLLHSLQQAAEGTGIYVNADKTEFMCFKQEGATSTLNGKPLNLVD